MRLFLSARLVLLFLLANVWGRPDGVRNPVLEENVKVSRSLQNATETQGQGPSDWFDGGGGNSASKNETAQSASPAAETTPPTGSNTGVGNANANATMGQNSPPPNALGSQSPQGVGTQNPASITTPQTETTTPPEAENPPGTQTPTEGDDDMEGNDDLEGNDDYGEVEGEGEEEWFEEPEEQRTKAPYVPPTGDDPFAKPPDESEWSKGESYRTETPEEMLHDRNVIIAVASAVFFGFVLALFSAQQVIENPDGCCASLCRCSVKFFCFFFKLLCFPCRMCCGNKDRRSHDLMVGSSDSYTHDLELT